MARRFALRVARSITMPLTLAAGCLGFAPFRCYQRVRFSIPPNTKLALWWWGVHPLTHKILLKAPSRPPGPGALANPPGASCIAAAVVMLPPPQCLPAAGSAGCCRQLPILGDGRLVCGLALAQSKQLREKKVLDLSSNLVYRGHQPQGGNSSWGTGHLAMMAGKAIY
jgi:hypothetical protein